MSNVIKQQRNEEIIKLYKNIISRSSINMGYLHRDAIFDVLMEQPAPRFYITPERAALLVIRYKKQLPSVINSPNVAMIEDLVATYDRIKAKRKYSSMEMIWDYVVNSPAKSFYLSKRRFKEVIFNYKGRNGSK